MGAFCTDVTIYHTRLQKEGASSRALLLLAAQRYSGLSPQQLGPVETNPWGKPFFPLHPRLQFSITHSGEWWMCAFSAHPIGLDLQLHRTHTPPERLSLRFFHPLEHTYLLQDSHRGFFDVWCAKESFVKYTGHGFYDAPETFSVVSESGVFPSASGVQFRLIPFVPGYSLCLCAQSFQEIELTALFAPWPQGIRPKPAQM